MQFGNTAFIIWRESVEALLVIGILNAWLAQQPDAAARRGRLFLWAGVGAGLVLSVAIGAALIGFAEVLSDEVQQLYTATVVLLAAALIVQMVVWMRRHGRTLKRDIERSLSQASDGSSWWRVFLLALIAVAREGAETVVFLSGTLQAARQEASLGGLGAAVAAAALGFALAVATYGMLQMGGRLFSWRSFFRVTEVMLLLLGGALVVTGVDNLIGLGALPSLSGRLWDTSGIMSDGGVLGGLVASLTGYRAKPNLMELAALALYWTAVLVLLRRPIGVARPAGVRPA